MKKRYFKPNATDIINRHLYNGAVKTIEGKHCCEVVKLEFHKSKLIELKINKEKVNFTQEEIDKWLNLLRENKITKFTYTVDATYHTISLNTFDFQFVNEMYITLLLVRYLWYQENNYLIDRIYDIMSTSKFTFFSALTTAHYYDEIKRDATFNLNHQQSFIFIDGIYDENNVVYDLFRLIPTINDYFLHRSVNRQGGIDTFLQGGLLTRLLHIFGRLAFKEVVKLTNSGATYTRVYEYITSLQQALGIYWTYLNPANYCDDIARQLTIITNKPCKVSLVTELEVNNFYIVISSNANNGNIELDKYLGLAYPNNDNEQYRKYKTFENRVSFKVEKDSLIYKVEF